MLGPLPNEFLIFAPLIALVAYTAYGLTGFGSTIIAVPLLAQIVPIKFAVPLMLLLDVVFGMFTGFRFRKQAQYREVMTLLPFILVGMAVGVLIALQLAWPAANCRPRGEPPGATKTGRPCGERGTLSGPRVL